MTATLEKKPLILCRKMSLLVQIVTRFALDSANPVKKQRKKKIPLLAGCVGF